MFTRIKYDVTFAPTLQYPQGRTFSREHKLQGGFGAIVGPNEQGKSLVLEFMRFLLFGSKALRGVTADYGNLAVEGDVLNWKIERTITNAKIWENGEVVARGTTPVNQYIMRRLGFNLAVFDVANSINQGEIEALQNMRPAERAKLVDQTVGLDKIDGLMTYANDTALALDREASAIDRTLVMPTQPVEPECWPNRGMIRDWLALAEEHQLELAKIDGQLAAPGIGKPDDPGPCPTEHTLEELRERVRDNQRHRELTAELERLPVIDTSEATEALETYEAWVAAQTFLRQNPAPTITLTEATEAIAYYDLAKVWADYNELHREYDRLKEAIAHAEKVDCPSCGHTFPLDADDVAALQTKLDEMTLNQPEQLLPEKAPRITYAEAEARIVNDDAIEKLLQEIEAARAVPQPHTPTYSRLDLEKYDPTRPSMIEAELATLAPLAGAEEMKDSLMAWEPVAAAYADRLAAWEEDQQRRAQLKAKREELAYAPERVADLRPVVARFDPYEQALARYEADRAAYNGALLTVAELRAQAEKWRAAKAALANLRTMIKQHLYPSLAKAASVLIAGMTSGQRRLVEIDEEFNILVDKQRLDTLSGSGKAVANLAIRLGLGQILTHRVFPVIFADEPDAAMDADRAASTQDILHQCANRVSQLILVSHKEPEADWLIDLGDPSGSQHNP